MKLWFKINSKRSKLQNTFELWIIHQTFVRRCIYVSYFLFAISIFLPIDNEGDLWEARKNYLSNSPTDFWGGWSAVIFGNFPDFFAGWQSNVIVLQLAATTYGIYRLFRQDKGVVQYLMLYVAGTFSTYNTRDSFLFSFLVLAFSLLSGSVATYNSIHGTMFRIAIFIVISSIAMALRPWNILAVTLLVFGVNKFSQGCKKVITGRITISICIFLVTVLPMTLEVSSAKLAKLEPAAPIQQVIVMDMAANYCWGTNQRSNKFAAEGLQIFGGSDFLADICSFYKPNAWVSLFNRSAMSASGLESKFALVSPGETELQDKLTELWKNMILSDIPTYLSNKSMQFAQVVVAGDGRTISLLEQQEKTSIKELVRAVYLFPFEIIIIFHVLSIAFISLLLLLVLVFRLGVVRQWKLAGLLLVGNLLWAATTTVVFVGDNGRYTYPYTLLSLIILFASRIDLKDKA